MEYRDRTFDGKEILLDGSTFTGCTFRNCVLVFRGAAMPYFGVNHFNENVEWIFDGAAMNALQLLAELYHSPGEFGREFVEQTFENIRRGALPEYPPADDAG